MAGRQTRGRQRIPIRRIENQDDLYATFSKRRLGLYKKASELSTLCGVDLGVIIFSPTDNPYSFFHPNMESVVDRYRNPNQPRDAYARAVENSTRSRIDDLNRRLDEVLEEKQQLKEHNKHLDEMDKTRQKGWWEETPIESLNEEQVKEWIEWFQAFKAQVETKIEELKNGASTSVPNPQNFTDVAGPSTGVGPSLFAPGPSFAQLMGIEQFPGNYYGVPEQAQDPSSAGDVSGQYFIPPLPQDPSAAGGSGGHILSQYLYTSPSQDPSAGHSGGSGHINPAHLLFPQPSQDPIDGGSGHVPSQYMFPQLPQDPSSSGGGGSGQFFFPPTSQGPSSGGGGGSGQLIFPPPSQDPSAGGSGHILGLFYLPPLTLNPSASGGITNPVPGRYRSINDRSGTQDPSTAGGIGESSPSDQQGGNN